MCKCGMNTVSLQTEDEKGNFGKVIVDRVGLSPEESRSWQMKLPVPYDELRHKKFIHIRRCDLLVPRCRGCGEKIAFFKTPANPAKNGDFRQGNMPVNFDEITKEDRYRFVLGLPVQYSALDHKEFVHWITCPKAKVFQRRSKIKNKRKKVKHEH